MLLCVRIATKARKAWPCAVSCYASLTVCFFFSSRRRHTRFDCDWSSDVCSSDLIADPHPKVRAAAMRISEPLLKNQAGLLNELLMHVNDAAPEVQLQLALTLGQEIGRAHV